MKHLHMAGNITLTESDKEHSTPFWPSAFLASWSENVGLPELQGSLTNIAVITLNRRILLSLSAFTTMKVLGGGNL